MQDIITVAVANFFPKRGDVPGNARRIEGLIRAASKRGADLLLLPELALTGYCDDPELPLEQKLHPRCSCTPDDPVILQLRQTACQCGIYAVLGMPERGEEGKFYNSALVCCPDGSALTYRKIHPFFQENNWASKGESPLLLETPFGKIGVGICHDTYSFPELPRYYAGMGARLYLNLTALNLIHTWDDFYSTTLRALVMQTGMFVASANLCGSDLTCSFPGGSVILGPSQGWLIDAQHTYCRIYAGSLDNCDPGLFFATLDLSHALPGVYQENPLTGSPDFRPQLYQDWYRQLSHPPKKQS